MRTNLSEHFDVKTEEETALEGVSVIENIQEVKAGLKDCDDIQTSVTEQMCANTVICMYSYSICILTIFEFHQNSFRCYGKHM